MESGIHIDSALAIDAHCHLSNSAFNSDRGRVFEGCKERGLVLVDSPVNPEELRTSLEFGSGRLGFYRTAGWEAARLDYGGAKEMAELIRASRHSLVGIGEVGLDRFWVRDRAKWDEQERVFRLFIGLADELDLPLVVHSRSAGSACIELLLSAGFRKVLMHAYDGSVGPALRAASEGFVFSIPPSIIRSEQKLKLVRTLPLGRLMLESDAPALGPVKGERNTPENCLLSASSIAEVKKIPLENVLSSAIKLSLEFFGSSLAAVST